MSSPNTLRFAPKEFAIAGLAFGPEVDSGRDGLKRFAAPGARCQRNPLFVFDGEMPELRERVQKLAVGGTKRERTVNIPA
jgi:hypothetical protein